jgi:hypothetical protein
MTLRSKRDAVLSGRLILGNDQGNLTEARQRRYVARRRVPGYRVAVSAEGRGKPGPEAVVILEQKNRPLRTYVGWRGELECMTSPACAPLSFLSWPFVGCPTSRLLKSAGGCEKRRWWFRFVQERRTPGGPVRPLECTFHAVLQPSNVSPRVDAQGARSLTAPRVCCPADRCRTERRSVRCGSRC